MRGPFSGHGLLLNPKATLENSFKFSSPYKNATKLSSLPGVDLIALFSLARASQSLIVGPTFTGLSIGLWDVYLLKTVISEVLACTTFYDTLL